MSRYFGNLEEEKEIQNFPSVINSCGLVHTGTCRIGGATQCRGGAMAVPCFIRIVNVMDYSIDSYILSIEHHGTWKFVRLVGCLAKFMYGLVVQLLLIANVLALLHFLKRKKKNVSTDFIVHDEYEVFSITRFTMKFRLHHWLEKRPCL